MDKLVGCLNYSDIYLYKVSLCILLLIEDELPFDLFGDLVWLQLSTFLIGLKSSVCTGGKKFLIPILLRDLGPKRLNLVSFFLVKLQTILLNSLLFSGI